MNEQELVQQIAETEQAYQDAQKRMVKAKAAYVEVESEVIEHKISLENMRDQLRRLRYRTPNYAPDARDQEIEEFRQKLPELLKKV
jgi:uncharacterized coiled-coil protein SlyX